MLAPESSRNYLAASSLQEEWSSASDLLLIDVRTPEAFQACPIPGAVNICVYKIEILDIQALLFFETAES